VSLRSCGISSLVDEVLAASTLTDVAIHLSLMNYIPSSAML